MSQDLDLFNIPLVVSKEWLIHYLDDPRVTIADCRFSLADPALGRQQYAAGHLPGAHFFDLNQDLSGLVKQHGGRHPLPDQEQLSRQFARLGLRANPGLPNSSTGKIVVAYDDSRLAFAARFWWLLQYCGYDQVAVLDGGFSGWQSAGFPITTEVPVPQTGQFEPAVRPELVIDIDQVKARKGLPGVVLVDSRESDRYRGEREPIDPIAGHIPGAVNYPWLEVTTPEGYVHPLAAQQQHWKQLAGAEEILVYCGSGVTACVNLLSLTLAGFSNGKLYAGSWSDWCSYLRDVDQSVYQSCVATRYSLPADRD